MERQNAIRLRWFHAALDFLLNPLGVHWLRDSRDRVHSLSRLMDASRRPLLLISIQDSPMPLCEAPRVPCQ